MIMYTTDLDKIKKYMMSTYGVPDFNIENIALGQKIILRGKKRKYSLKIKKVINAIANEYMVEIN